MSNKKTLLNEGTIRRFMKLANMDNLAESYLDRFEVNEEEEVEEGMGGKPPRKKDDNVKPPRKKDEDVKEEGMYAAKDDEDVKEEGMYAAKDDEEEPAKHDLDEEEEMELDMGAEAEMDEPMDALDDEGAAADEAMVKKLVDAIAGAIEGATGVEVAVEGGDEEPEMDMGDEEPAMGMGDEADAEDDADALELDDEAAKHDGVMEEDDFNSYIAEVTRRVAKRIIKKKISK